MAATTVTILSSPPHGWIPPGASSPALPSPSVLLLGQRRLASTLKAQKVSGAADDVKTLATTTISLGPRRGGPLGDGTAPDEPATVKPRRRRKHSLPENANAGKSRENEAPNVVVRDDAKAKKSSKKQGKVQTRVMKGKITKPLVINQKSDIHTNVDKAGKEDRVSWSCAEQTVEKLRNVDSALTSEGLGLEGASKRRPTWTPPRNTVAILDLSETTADVSARTAEVAVKHQEKDFGNICRAFGFNGIGDDSVDSRPSTISSAETSKKRRRIQPGKSKATQTEASDVTEKRKTKPKASKKKARTITEQATAYYAFGQPQSIKVVPLSQRSPHKRHLGAQDTIRETALPQDQHQESTLEIQPCAEPFPRKACAKKKPAKRESKKQDSKTKEILLSPQSAFKQIENQTFLFGTSSQLAREESPTFTKDLQRAIIASEVAHEQLTGSTRSMVDSQSSLSSGNRLSASTSSKSLWSVAAGGTSDSLGRESHKDGKIQTKPSSVADGFCTLSPSPTAESLYHEQEFHSKSKCQPLKPDFEGYPTAKLASELTSYGFKPMKNRKSMIALTEKCWEGKHRIALKTLQANASLSSHDEEQRVNLPLKRPRGRPRKAPPREALPSECGSSFFQAPARPEVVKKLHVNVGRKSAATAEEVPSASTVPTNGPRNSPPSAILPSSDKISRSTLDAATHEARQFSHITKAIRSQPLSTMPSSVTWQERILMYDPVVLEELTLWLNTQGLGAVGVDYEVDISEVRLWCQQNSVCCLSAQNLRGGARTRY